MMIQSPKYRFALLAALLAATLAGCGKAQEEAKSGTQVAAKVDGSEITVSQINFALSQMPQIHAGQSTEAQRQALEALVDQQLFMQKAVAEKLDRNPRVLEAIQSAKRQILAQAYVEKRFQAITPPTAAEIQSFYDAHPELFKDRRIYRFQGLTVTLTPQDAKRVEAHARSAGSLDELAGWLQGQNIRFARASSVKSAEQFPFDILPQVAKLQDGQTGVFPVRGSLFVMHLAGSQLQPLDEKQATPFITRYLVNKKRIGMTQDLLKNLRQAAKIKYVGVFAETGKPEEAVATSAAPAQATPVAEHKGDETSALLEKGLSGLK